MEKVVATQLTDHLEVNQLLHPQQFGFRSRHSTEIANCCFIKNLKSMDRGEVVGAVFLDLKKAFETVSHHLLLSKISRGVQGGQGGVLTWLSRLLLWRYWLQGSGICSSAPAVAPREFTLSR